MHDHVFLTLPSGKRVNLDTIARIESDPLGNGGEWRVWFRDNGQRTYTGDDALALLAAWDLVSAAFTRMVTGAKRREPVPAAASGMTWQPETAGAGLSCQPADVVDTDYD